MDPPDDAGAVGSFEALPDPVRARLAAIASAALDGLPEIAVPAPVRRLAHFAPAKRSRLGAAALVAALRDSVAFRAAVLAWWDEHRPGELTAGDTDPPTAAAAALLADAPDAGQRIAEAARHHDAGGLRAERDAALARADKLSAEVERLRAELAAARDGARDAHRARDAELERMRRTLSEQGARLRRATDSARAAEAALAEQHRTAADVLAQARAERDRERARAERDRVAAAQAAAEVSVARQAARQARQADEVRLELLLDTLSGAVAGLRRELALGGGLGGGGARPADLVHGASPLARAAKVSDVSGLDRLLALPSVHLIVDGYNVSKTGYPELTLADQRDRLVNQLAALAARTRAEVTVVFDGAGVGAAGGRAARGVRVLFSDPGVLADDVIRALVAAEPEGRPVVVATSDRAVAESVHRRGAHPLGSAVLLARLGRS